MTQESFLANRETEEQLFSKHTVLERIFVGSIGLFTAIFRLMDVIFILSHVCLYRHSYQKGNANKVLVLYVIFKSFFKSYRFKRRKIVKLLWIRFSLWKWLPYSLAQNSAKWLRGLSTFLYETVASLQIWDVKEVPGQKWYSVTIQAGTFQLLFHRFVTIRCIKTMFTI